MLIIQNPTQFKIPTWFLNRQKDIVDGKNSQILSNVVDSKLREDLERLKKIRAHRGLRHYWGLRVRGQHTKTTGSSFFHFSFPGFLIFCGHRPSWKDCWCIKEAWLECVYPSDMSFLHEIYIVVSCDHITSRNLQDVS